MYPVMVDGMSIRQIIRETELPAFHIAPSSVDLVGAEVELSDAIGRELHLRRALQPIVNDYDYILIDSPPSLGLLTVNGLTAANSVLVPMQCEYFAIEGIAQLLHTIERVTTQKKVLGRGLGELIPARPIDSAGGLMQLALDQIAPNPYQPRRMFNEASIEELARSVREHGIVQPLVVSRAGDHYNLVAGERRYRAAQRAGLETVPVIVKELAQKGEALEIALIENIQREDLNPMEEASAYQQLHQDFGLTQEEISRRVGKERSTIANFLRLLKLPDPVKTLLASGQLSMGHARALLALDSAKKQQQLAERVVKNNLNVRQTEVLASEGIPKPARKEKEKDVFTRDAEERLTRTLRTKVEIDRKRRGGVIRISFAGEDDLIRIYDELTGRRR